MWTTLYILTAIALFFRLFFWMAMPRVLDFADSVLYLEVAGHFRDAAWFLVDPKIPPLYPLLTGWMGLLTGDLEFAGQLVSFIASTLTLIPLFLLGRDLFDTRSARNAVLLVALWGWLADYACRVSTEALAVLLWVSAVYALQAALRRNGFMILAAACCFFLLHLTRPEGTFVALAALPASVLLTWSDAKRRLFLLIPFALLLGGLLYAHGCYLEKLTGVFTLNYRTEFLFLQPEGSTYLNDTVKAFTGIFHEKPALMLGPLLWIFVGAGLFASRPGETRRVRLELYVLFFAFAQAAMVVANASPAPRYIMAPLLVALLWAGRGIDVASALSPRALLRLAPITLCVLFMFFNTVLTVGAEHMGNLPREPREYKMAGQWMKANLEPGLILSRKPQIGYYADMPTSGPLFDESLDEIHLRVREGAFRYLVVDARYSAQQIPALRPLLYPANAPAWLELLKDDSSPYPAGRVVIYKVVEEQPR